MQREPRSPRKKWDAVRQGSQPSGIHFVLKRLGRAMDAPLAKGDTLSLSQRLQEATRRAVPSYFPRTARPYPPDRLPANHVPLPSGLPRGQVTSVSRMDPLGGGSTDSPPMSQARASRARARWKLTPSLEPEGRRYLHSSGISARATIGFRHGRGCDRMGCE